MQNLNKQLLRRIFLKIRIVRGNTGLYYGEFYSNLGNWINIPFSQSFTKLGCKIAIKSWVRYFNKPESSVVEVWDE